DRRAAHAVVAVRSGRRAFYEAGDTDAAVDALRAQARLFGTQLWVAHTLDQHIDAALMRQVLELDAAGRGRRIAVVRHDVAAAHLDGIDLQGRRGPVHQVLAHAIADRVAHGAILRGRRLVLIDDRRPPAIVLVPVGPARDVEDLRALEHAGAR